MPSDPKKIGGEYGKVRANIDTDKLNAYLAKNDEGISTPVDIKQFTVRYIHSWMERRLLTY
jgi:hypothetical protein